MDVRELLGLSEVDRFGALVSLGAVSGYGVVLEMGMWRIWGCGGFGMVGGHFVDVVVFAATMTIIWIMAWHRCSTTKCAVIGRGAF